MSQDPYRLRQREFVHALWLALFPPCVHLFFVLFIGAEADRSSLMLGASVIAAVTVGGWLHKKGYGPFASALAAAWPAVLAVHRQWFWVVDMHSPGGASQAVARALGWEDPSATEAMAVLMAAFGGAGWLGVSFDAWRARRARMQPIGRR